MTQPLKLHISETIGHVSAELLVPHSMKAIFTLAHGAGAGMHHPFMVNLANALAAENIGTLRFNFPYMEQKKKRPDVPAIAHTAVEAALNYVHEHYPKIPIYASGKSFGGRMSSQLLALRPPHFVSGIVFFGFPFILPVNQAQKERYT